MKNMISKKKKRIALISIAAAALMVCSPLTVFAANTTSDTRTKVVYAGDGTTKTVQVLNADNLDTFMNLMPGDTTKAQQITIQNKCSQKMKVYFHAEPTGTAEAAISQKLLDKLQLQITFKMDDNSAAKVLYNGPASGKTGTTASSAVTNDVTNQILLGYVYGNAESGLISATLTAPEDMDNQYQAAKANIKWVMQFELLEPEVVSENSVPLVNPPSNGPDKPTVVSENPIPLSPVTGDTQTRTYVWILAAVILVAVCVIAVMRIQNRKSSH
ncbi:MAG TPA: hypothetical protein VHO94_02140 [Oscillospiraceae bacterium]|nr:hypothetical protein [Oscillospiraceae bacterium]